MTRTRHCGTCGREARHVLTAKSQRGPQELYLCDRSHVTKRRAGAEASPEPARTTECGSAKCKLRAVLVLSLDGDLHYLCSRNHVTRRRAS